MNHHLGACLIFPDLLRLGRPTVRVVHHFRCTITMNHLNAKWSLRALFSQPYLMVMFPTFDSCWLVPVALFKTLRLPYKAYTAWGVPRWGNYPDLYNTIVCYPTLRSSDKPDWPLFLVVESFSIKLFSLAISSIPECADIFKICLWYSVVRIIGFLRSSGIDWCQLEP